MLLIDFVSLIVSLVVVFLLVVFGIPALYNWELRRDIKRYNSRYPCFPRSINITNKEMRNRVRDLFIYCCCDKVEHETVCDKDED